MRRWGCFCHPFSALLILHTQDHTEGWKQSEASWVPVQHQLSQPLLKTSANILNIHLLTLGKTHSADPHLTEEKWCQAKNWVTSPSSLSCSLATRHFTFSSFPPATAHSILEAHLHSPKNPKQNVEPRITKHHPLVLEQDAGLEEGPTNTAIISLIFILGSFSRHKDFQ